MRLFEGSNAEIAALDAQPWDVPLAFAVRRFNIASIVRLSVAAAALFQTAGIASVIAVAGGGDRVRHPAGSAAVAAYSLAAGFVIALLPLLLGPAQLRRWFPIIGFSSAVTAPLLIPLALVSAGPNYGVAAAFYVEPVLFGFYMLRRHWAVLCTALTIGSFALLIALQPGWTGDGGWLEQLGHIAILGAAVVAPAILMAGIAERADALAEAEHTAREQLAEVNRTLEARVSEQVTEIERLGQLRRFLAPQVADTVLAEGNGRLAEPHRQQIAVFFCDLRGFTAFTNKAEPEDVITVLHDYYATVGELLQRYEATIGGYAGDGIMAYFGDPVPHEAPALAAAKVAADLRGPMDALARDWARRGFDLGYGIGVAFGYATLGVVGFDGRFDYTPIGAVVNLAARLCAHSHHGQVLLDHATHVATVNDLSSVFVADVDLKGYGSSTRAYALV